MSEPVYRCLDETASLSWFVIFIESSFNELVGEYLAERLASALVESLRPKFVDQPDLLRCSTPTTSRMRRRSTSSVTPIPKRLTA
jgi:hypothetical protein